MQSDRGERDTLEPGATVLLHTGGIVEHGRPGIDAGTPRLATALEKVAHLPLDELCDQLLPRLAAGRTDDDIRPALVRCHPEDTGTHLTPTTGARRPSARRGGPRSVDAPLLS